MKSNYNSKGIVEFIVSNQEYALYLLGILFITGGKVKIPGVSIQFNGLLKWMDINKLNKFVQSLTRKENELTTYSNNLEVNKAEKPKKKKKKKKK